MCNDAAKLKVGHDDFRVALYHLDRTLRAHVHVGLPPHTVHNGRKSFKHIWSNRWQTLKPWQNKKGQTFDGIFLNYCLWSVLFLQQLKKRLLFWQHPNKPLALHVLSGLHNNFLFSFSIVITLEFWIQA